MYSMTVVERLASFCSVFRTVAAVRLATSPAKVARARHVAKVYMKLKDLQGLCVPK